MFLIEFELNFWEIFKRKASQRCHDKSSLQRLCGDEWNNVGLNTFFMRLKENNHSAKCESPAVPLMTTRYRLREKTPTTLQGRKKNSLETHSSFFWLQIAQRITSHILLVNSHVSKLKSPEDRVVLLARPCFSATRASSPDQIWPFWQYVDLLLPAFTSAAQIISSVFDRFNVSAVFGKLWKKEEEENFHSTQTLAQYKHQSLGFVWLSAAVQ